jgi:CheY-like chemotaxis protein
MPFANQQTSRTMRARQAWDPGPATALADKRILVVDDDPDTRHLLELIFARTGAVVKEASSADDAFASLLEFRPQLVISDVVMPTEDGCSLMRRIRELAAESGGLTPAIALTANEGSAERREALRAGFTAYLKKPVSVANLIETAVSVIQAAAPIAPRR